MASDICCFGFVGHLTVGISGIWDLFYSKYHYDWIKQLFLLEYNNIDMFFPCCLIQDKACDAMEIFDELVESEVSIVTPHVRALIEFCLQVCDLLNVLLQWVKFMALIM